MIDHHILPPSSSQVPAGLLCSGNPQRLIVKREHEAGALRSQDLKRVTVDTTVQPKAITFPTDAKLLHAAIKGLNRLARRHGVRLRQSYSRVAKAAAMMAGRYAHAKQFRRHQRQLRIYAAGSAGSSATSAARSTASRLRCGPFNGSADSNREFRQPSVWGVDSLARSQTRIDASLTNAR